MEEFLAREPLKEALLNYSYIYEDEFDELCNALAGKVTHSYNPNKLDLDFKIGQTLCQNHQ
ncbi:hypothetical protein RDI58_000802 [Solanum bulbocastanum]|uniref:Uncharacterized protein n=1 Tax=Solanum bulbocastanum TaxID=147425 RepID=A0AAN8U6V5_SOLBU